MFASASATCVIGIDIGLTGALALVDENGKLIDCFDMPVLADGPARRRSINGPLLAELLARSHATMAFVEHVGVRPGEGPVGAFAFGRCRGLVEGALAALSIPTSFIAAASWKRTIGIAPGKAGAKDAARSEAIRRWPDKGVPLRARSRRWKGRGGLIACAGLMRRQNLP